MIPPTPQNITQRLSNLRNDVEQYRKLHAQLEDLQVLLELAIEEDDQTVSEEIQRDLKGIAAEVEGIEFKLMLSGEHDPNNAILSIHPGAGGTESQDWAAMLMRMHLRWCEARNYKTETIELLPGEEAGIKSATILVTGEYAYGYLRAEAGIHRLVRLSPSILIIVVTPLLQLSPFPLKLVITLMSRSIRRSAYRNLQIGWCRWTTCQPHRFCGSDDPPSHRNCGTVSKRKITTQEPRNGNEVLRSRVYEYYEAQRNEEISKLQGDRLGIDFGSQIRSYVFHPYRLVKDLRTGVETGNIDAVMDGELDQFIESYLKDVKSDKK